MGKTLLASIILGALAGWLAGKIMKKRGSFIKNLILGIVGSVVGGAIANALHISGGFIVELIIAVVGACIILWIGGLFSKKR